MIRQAESKDKQPCCQLNYMAGQVIFDYFFADTKCGVMPVIEFMYDTPDTFMSAKWYWVDDEAGRVRGAAVVYPGKNKKELEKNMGNYGRDFVKLVGWGAIFKMLVRGRMNKLLDVIDEDEMYLQALAVFPDHRGKHVSTGLINQAKELTKKEGLTKLSVLAEPINEHACMVYEKYGFKTVLTRELPGKYHKHKLYSFYKMVAEV